MRRLILIPAALALLAACADAGGVPLDGSEIATSPSPVDASDTGEVVTDEGSGLETWDGELAAVDDPIAHEPAEQESIPGDDVSSEETNPKPLPPESVPKPEPIPAVTGEVPADLMDAILADARSRLSTEASITVVRGQSVTWSDGSLGCPEAGMVYTQALVGGYWVVLDADGQTLDYRAGSSGGFRYCPFGGRPPSGEGDT